MINSCGFNPIVHIDGTMVDQYHLPLRRARQPLRSRPCHPPCVHRLSACRARARLHASRKTRATAAAGPMSNDGL